MPALLPEDGDDDGQQHDVGEHQFCYEQDGRERLHRGVERQRSVGSRLTPVRIVLSLVDDVRISSVAVLDTFIATIIIIPRCFTGTV